ncbi:MAG: hypothetical protein A2020_12690 [Lentisphaerae bacterium GWF2_45_14]|nr:MAG: hypothetical protein A2020_12690 [Lentisphaerae bacterium GWF2_45_14]
MKNGEIIRNKRLKDNYFRVDFYSPELCKQAKAGQFAHVKICGIPNKVLRRPFSISDVSSEGLLTIIYKVVGAGTEALSSLKPGDTCDIMGPLGNPFSPSVKSDIPVIIAGGYGAAATYLIAKNSPSPGILLLGARTAKDLILTDEFKRLGFEVKVSTEDASEGYGGRVTGLMEELLADKNRRNMKFYACGPHGMLMAAGKLILQHGLDGELSLDHLMCCGVGACFACVVKVKADNSDGWRYARTCKEGPVFKASEVYYDLEPE